MTSFTQYNIFKIYPCYRLTGLRGEAGGGLEEINLELVCIWAQPMDANSNVVKAWGGAGAGWEGGKRGGGNGGRVILSTMKTRFIHVMYQFSIPSYG